MYALNAGVPANHLRHEATMNEWHDISKTPPDGLYARLKCSDGIERSGIAYHYPDGALHGWMVDETADFKSSQMPSYTVLEYQALPSEI